MYSTILGKSPDEDFFFQKIFYAKSFTGCISQHFFKIPKGGVRRDLAALAPELGVTRWLNHLKDFQTTFDHLMNSFSKFFYIFFSSFYKIFSHFSQYIVSNFFKNSNILAILRLTTSISIIPPRGPKKGLQFYKKCRILKFFSNDI